VEGEGDACERFVSPHWAGKQHANHTSAPTMLEIPDFLAQVPILYLVSQRTSQILVLRCERAESKIHEEYLQILLSPLPLNLGKPRVHSLAHHLDITTGHTVRHFYHDQSQRTVKETHLLYAPFNKQHTYPFVL